MFQLGELVSGDFGVESWACPSLICSLTITRPRRSVGACHSFEVYAVWLVGRIHMVLERVVWLRIGRMLLKLKSVGHGV